MPNRTDLTPTQMPKTLGKVIPMIRPNCPAWCTNHNADGHRGREIMIRIGRDQLSFRMHGPVGDEIADCEGTARIRGLLDGDLRLGEAMLALAEALA